MQAVRTSRHTRQIEPGPQVAERRQISSRVPLSDEGPEDARCPGDAQSPRPHEHLHGHTNALWGRRGRIGAQRQISAGVDRGIPRRLSAVRGLPRGRRLRPHFCAEPRLERHVGQCRVERAHGNSPRRGERTGLEVRRLTRGLTAGPDNDHSDGAAVRQRSDARPARSPRSAMPRQRRRYVPSNAVVQVTPPSFEACQCWRTRPSGSGVQVMR